MFPLLVALFALPLYYLVRFLHLTTPASAPLIYAKDKSSQFVQSVLTLCPILQQPYFPPLLWGKSGYIQSVLYILMGRVNVSVPSGIRHSILMTDGATLTFDLYEPKVQHKSGEPYCLLICPGIGGNSESNYIRALVDYAQMNGYMAVVLNHIGTNKNIPMTAPRLFTYGGTEELHMVRKEVQMLHPDCGIILIGCSMGGNIVVKYLGEDRDHQVGILAAVSICQGYDAMKAKLLLKSGQYFEKAILYMMTRRQKNLIRIHKDQLLSEEIRCKCNIDENSVFSALNMVQLDEAFTRRFLGYQTVDEYYRLHSSGCYLSNIRIPLLLVNAEDDPGIPMELLEDPKAAAAAGNTMNEKMPNVIFALTKHGGHLGFFEKGFWCPDRITWMDRLIVQYADTIVTLLKEGVLPLIGDIKKLDGEIHEPLTPVSADIHLEGVGSGKLAVSLPVDAANRIHECASGQVMSGFFDLKL